MRGGSGAGWPGAGGRAGDVGFSFRKQAPVSRLHAERIEQMLVDVRGSHAHGTIAGEEVLLAGRERADC